MKYSRLFCWGNAFLQQDTLQLATQVICTSNKVSLSCFEIMLETVAHAIFQNFYINS